MLLKGGQSGSTTLRRVHMKYTRSVCILPRKSGNNRVNTRPDHSSRSKTLSLVSTVLRFHNLTTYEYEPFVPNSFLPWS